MAICESAEHPVPCSHPKLAEALFALDAVLRRRHEVVEYTTDPLCIFRLDIARSCRECELPDGTRLHTGQRIVRLHFWNEHIPPAPPNGATIGWALGMQRRIALSLHELARYLSSRPGLGDIAMIGGDVPCGTRAQSRQLARIMAHYGFQTVAEDEDQLTLGERAHRFGENILISLIVFVQNSGALRIDSLNRVRVPVYLSRRSLEERFGAMSKPVSQAKMRS
jgi:hypothetical protein